MKECDICEQEFYNEYFCNTCSGLQEDPDFVPHVENFEVCYERYVDEPDIVLLSVCWNCCKCVGLN